MKKIVWAMVSDTPDEPASVVLYKSYAEANEAARAFYMDTWTEGENAEGEPLGEPPADWEDLRMELQEHGYFERYADVTHHTIETDELENQ